MMESTLFLSQLIGPIAIILGLSMAFRQEAYNDFIENLAKNRSLLLYNGVIESTAGLALVLYHNLWTSPATVIITLLGWGMLLEGTIDLFVSKKTIKEIAHADKAVLAVTAAALIVLGGYLAFIGYFPQV